MTTTTLARARVSATPRSAVGQLARIEAGRMLRHPAPWIGVALSAWFATVTVVDTWASSAYHGPLIALTPLLLGVSVASASAFAREHTAVSDDAPMSLSQRSLARLLGGLGLVGLVAVVVAAGAGWLAVTGGLPLGDEPGRTEHASYSAPELLQPVLLAAFAVTLGAALAHALRHPLGASIVAFVVWFLLGPTYWLSNGPVARWLTPVQVQPIPVDVGPAETDPTTFPSTWLLSTPGEYQEQWVRLVVSPAVAGWHDVYLVGLALLLGAAAVPGRLRRPALLAGLLLAAVAVAMQRAVMP